MGTSRHLLTLVLIALAACTSGKNATPSSANEPDTDDRPSMPGLPVEVDLQSAALAELESDLAEVQDLDAEQLRSAYPTSFEAAIPYEPTQAESYGLIQDSDLALTDSEEATFAEHGFVVVPRHGFATFSYGYHSIYVQDLPVYVTADSVLDALHRSYDDILEDLEKELLADTLSDFLGGMRGALADADGPLQARRDADFMLAMAQSLLLGRTVDPAFDDSFDADQLKDFFDDAVAARGIQQREIFGFERRLDFSQFKPRGHYEGDEVLERYFRAMMWLGRIDLRMVETRDDGTRVLRRNQAEAAILLRELMDEERFAQWSLIDRVVTAFVGEHDYMTAAQIGELKDGLGVASLAELAEVSDDELARAIIEGNYGEQRIASHVMRKADVFAPELPLNASFAVFGQRYVVDSHVFSQVVFDRVDTRVVPDPLDVAFAALGNDQALNLLQQQMAEHQYAGNLAAMRTLVDAQPEESWTSSLYTLWLGALRELSAGAQPAGTGVTTQDGSEAALPSVARTHQWGVRLLNTQLASWAQLRHDTLLYAKQSYTGFGDCQYPDAYVDPYPELWSRLLLFAERGAVLVDDLQLESQVLDDARAYFARFTEIVSVLHAMSEHQVTGLPHDPAHLEFINRAVVIYDGGSGPPEIEGWYHGLLYDRESFSERDLTIADVHTDPGGPLPISREASVLHVGTGSVRLMAVSVDSCEGPRAYLGPVFAYKQLANPGTDRLTDSRWREMVDETYDDPTTYDPPWMGQLYGTR